MPNLLLTRQLATMQDWTIALQAVGAVLLTILLFIKGWNVLQRFVLFWSVDLEWEPSEVYKPPEHGEVVRIMTFNTFLLPGCCTKGMSANRVNSILKLCAPYEIVALQEVFATVGTWTLVDLIKRARDYGFHYHVMGSFVSALAIVDSGLLVLSKYPIVRTSFYKYKHACSWDKLSSKGILYACIQLGTDSSTQIHLFNTHLQSTYHEDDTSAFEVQRNQLHSLQQFVEVTMKGTENKPVYIVGDFNMDSSCASGQSVLHANLGVQFQDTCGSSEYSTIWITYDYKGKTLSTTWRPPGFKEPNVANSVTNDSSSDDSDLDVADALLSENSGKRIVASRIDYVFESKRLAKLVLRHQHTVAITATDGERISDHDALVATFLYQLT